jgi:hypothetical protein
MEDLACHASDKSTNNSRGYKKPPGTSLPLAKPTQQKNKSQGTTKSHTQPKKEKDFMQATPATTKKAATVIKNSTNTKKKALCGRGNSSAIFPVGYIPGVAPMRKKSRCHRCHARSNIGEK